MHTCTLIGLYGSALNQKNGVFAAPRGNPTRYVTGRCTFCTRAKSVAADTSLDGIVQLMVRVVVEPWCFWTTALLGEHSS